MNRDYSKLGLVAKLQTEVDLYIISKDYAMAKMIAEEMASYGYPINSSHVYRKLQKATRNPIFMEKAKELLIPAAEDFCKKGQHLFEASCYKRLGMNDFYDFAMEEHNLIYRSKNCINPPCLYS